MGIKIAASRFTSRGRRFIHFSKEIAVLGSRCAENLSKTAEKRYTLAKNYGIYCQSVWGGLSNVRHHRWQWPASVFSKLREIYPKGYCNVLICSKKNDSSLFHNRDESQF